MLEGNVRGTAQALLAGGQYASGWTTVPEHDGSSTYYVSSAAVSAGNLSVGTLTAAVRHAAALGRTGLRASHRAWWHAFYPAAFVTVSDAKLE